MIFSVPPAIFSSQILYIVKFPAIECLFKLPEILHIFPGKIVPFIIEIIKCNNFMSSTLQFINKFCPNRPCTTSYRNLFCFHDHRSALIFSNNNIEFNILYSNYICIAQLFYINIKSIF